MPISTLPADVRDVGSRSEPHYRDEGSEPRWTLPLCGFVTVFNRDE
jgi:hypothetical protein